MLLSKEKRRGERGRERENLTCAVEGLFDSSVGEGLKESRREDRFEDSYSHLS